MDQKQGLLQKGGETKEKKYSPRLTTISLQEIRQSIAVPLQDISKSSNLRSLSIIMFLLFAFTILYIVEKRNSNEENVFLTSLIFSLVAFLSFIFLIIRVAYYMKNENGSNILTRFWPLFFFSILIPLVLILISLFVVNLMDKKETLDEKYIRSIFFGLLIVCFSVLIFGTIIMNKFDNSLNHKFKFVLYTLLSLIIFIGIYYTAMLLARKEFTDKPFSSKDKIKQILCTIGMFIVIILVGFLSYLTLKKPYEKRKDITNCPLLSDNFWLRLSPMIFTFIFLVGMSIASIFIEKSYYQEVFRNIIIVSSITFSTVILTLCRIRYN